MKAFSTYLLGLSLTLAVAGCSKKADPVAAAPAVSANTALLTTPKWRISAIVGTTNFAGQIITVDGYAGFPACQKDNFAKFNIDKSAVADEGATKCSGTDPQSKQGTWSFNTAETQLTTVDSTVPAGSPNSSVTADLLQLTATTLQVRTTNTQTISGVTVVTTATTTYTAF